MINRIHQGDVLTVLRSWPDSFVDCCVTSPPYWGLRDYGVDGQLGLEKTPEEYISKMVEVFREVRRVLKPEGTCWVNMGDSYSSGGRDSHGTRVGYKQASNRGTMEATGTRLPMPEGCKPKDLVGIPWFLAFALRADGWWLRQDIIWHKTNPMPESVTDRCTKSHEYLFLLTKSAKYFFDQEAIREPHQEVSLKRALRNRFGGKYRDADPHEHGALKSGNGYGPEGNPDIVCSPGGRNRRSVWTIATEPTPEAHFATFPRKLIEPCILAGTSEKGYCPECGKAWVRRVEKESIDTGRGRGKEPAQCRANLEGHQQVGVYCNTKTLGFSSSCTCGVEPVPGIVLDHFMGSGTTALVAYEHRRRWIGIELNQEYIKMARRRIAEAEKQMRIF